MVYLMLTPNAISLDYKNGLSKNSPGKIKNKKGNKINFKKLKNKSCITKTADTITK